MENRIKVLILNNGSVQFLEKLPTINQGSTNNYLEVYSETPLSNDYLVEVSFRRNDGKTTSYLTLNDIKDEKNIIKYYQLKMNSDWYTYCQGDLYLTFKISRLIQDEVSNTKIVELYKTANTSVYINPTSDFYKPSPVTPTNYEILLDRLNTVDNRTEDLENANLVKEISTGETVEIKDVNGVRKANTSIKYETYDGSVNNVIINLPDGLATELEVNRSINDKFDNVKPLVDIDESNNDLEFVVKGYNKPDKTIKIKTDSLITEEEYTNRTAELTDDLVAYEKLSDGVTPSVQVSFAEQAEKDGLGRIIDETYITNNTNQDIIKRSFQIDRTHSGESTFVNYGANDDGTISLLTKDEEGNTGTVYFKPTTGFIRTIGPVNVNNNIQNLPFINQINTFEQPQVFTEQIDLLNVDGTRDSIKHLNDNFLISSSDGTNLMDIDSGSKTVSFFNKDIAYKNEIIALNNTIDALNNKVLYFVAEWSSNYVNLYPNTATTVALSQNGNAYIYIVDTNSTGISAVNGMWSSTGSFPTINFNIQRTVKVGDL